MFRRYAFTLVELLVSLSIVAVLAVVLSSALSPSLGRSRATKCLDQLRQIGTAAQTYAAEHDGRLPGSQHEGALNSWALTLQPYLGGKALFRCPEDGNKTRTRSYAMNDYLIPGAGSESDYSRITNIPAVSATFYLAETANRYSTSDHFHFAPANDGDYSATSFAGQVAVERHNHAANYLFADGHVTSLTWDEARQKLTIPGDRFVDPAGNHRTP
jgi:prepilin-type processing-associated H-X9-DG protein/prepilin-type N-terminal cleavage/methylation domain-containing protein